MMQKIFFILISLIYFNLARAQISPPLLPFLLNQPSWQSPQKSNQKPPAVGDRTGGGLHKPVPVMEVIKPKDAEEVSEKVKNASVISVGGAYYSMGGQTVAEGGVHFDMRQFNKILNFDPKNKLITVQAGTNWRQIQEKIDSSNLSVKNMQTYVEFSVAGAIATNVHGRYANEGSFVDSVESFQIILADGQVVKASRIENPDIFYNTFGAFGATGIITEVTLKLVDNVNIERTSKVMFIEDYKKHFDKYIKNNPQVIFHNAYYDQGQIRIVNWIKTNKPVTVANRLMPKDQSDSYKRSGLEKMSRSDLAKWFRGNVFDEGFYKIPAVVKRNYEAGQSTTQLPQSTPESAFLLQEYFIPVNQVTNFTRKMDKIIDQYHVNVLNNSIRYSPADPRPLLSWHPQEVFSFVIFYQQGTTNQDKKNAEIWSRKMIDAAESAGGTFYPPYEKHATPEQFKKGYPNIEKFKDFIESPEIDPEHKFSQTEFWKKYLH